jgi:hypothetical protein
MNSNDLIFVAALLIAFVAATWADRQTRGNGTTSAALIAAQGAQISKLLEENKDLAVRNAKLQTELDMSKHGRREGEETSPDLAPARYTPDTLLIGGPDPTIVDRDLKALHNAGIDFIRLDNATEVDIHTELATKRQDGQLYSTVIISSHGWDVGIDTYDPTQQDHRRTTPPSFWVDNLFGVKLVCLALCQGTTIANAIVGRVRVVVYFREGVDSDAAGEFVTSFMGKVGCGLSPEQSYDEARDVVPSVREFVQIRVARPSLATKKKGV